jgi:hypothetical protein
MRLTTGPEPSSFDFGTDLLLTSGAPWSISTGLTWRWASNDDDSVHVPLASSVIAQGLANAANVARWNARRNLSTIGQPFLVDFTVIGSVWVGNDVRWQFKFACYKDKLFWKKGAFLTQFFTAPG